MGVIGKGSAAATTIAQVATAVAEAIDVNYEAAQSSVGQIVGYQSVGNTSFLHPFVIGRPQMRVWTGERVPTNIVLGEKVGKTQKWEVTHNIPLDDMLSDTIGAALVKADKLGTIMRRHPDWLLAYMLVDKGTSTDAEWLSWDGLPLFSDSHVTGDNLFASTAFTEANLASTWAAMASYTDGRGNNLGVRPTHIISSPYLEPTISKVLDTATVNVAAGGQIDNIWSKNKYRLEHIVLPELADRCDTNTTWYLVDASKGVMPAMHYEFRAVERTDLSNPTDPNVFNNDELVYGAQGSDIVMAGVHQLWAKCTA